VRTRPTFTDRRAPDESRTRYGILSDVTAECEYVLSRVIVRHQANQETGFDYQREHGYLGADGKSMMTNSMNEKKAKGVMGSDELKIGIESLSSDTVSIQTRPTTAGSSCQICSRGSACTSRDHKMKVTNHAAVGIQYHCSARQRYTRYI